jgi:hypothetical protein
MTLLPMSRHEPAVHLPHARGRLVPAQLGVPPHWSGPAGGYEASLAFPTVNRICLGLFVWARRALLKQMETAVSGWADSWSGPMPHAFEWAPFVVPGLDPGSPFPRDVM